MVYNDPEIFKHGVFGQIETRFDRSNVEIKQLEGKVKYLEEFIDSKIVMLDKQLKSSSETANSINSFKQSLKVEVSNQNSKLVESVQNIYSNFDQINSDIKKLTLGIENCHTQSQQALQSATTSEINFLSTSASLDSKVASFDESIKDIKFRV